jgi:hypothetical protein
MKRVKEFTIKLSEDNKAPIVEIDGEKLRGITNLMVKYNSDDAVDAPFDNGFRVEYISEENGLCYKQTIGQSFHVVQVKRK